MKETQILRGLHKARAHCASGYVSDNPAPTSFRGIAKSLGSLFSSKPKPTPAPEQPKPVEQSEPEQSTAEKAAEVIVPGTMNAIQKRKALLDSLSRGTAYLDGPGTGTSDSIPAMLSKGEAVLPAKTVRKVGAHNIARLIADTNGKAPQRSLRSGLHAADGLIDDSQLNTAAAGGVGVAGATAAGRKSKKAAQAEADAARRTSQAAEAERLNKQAQAQAQARAQARAGAVPGGTTTSANPLGAEAESINMNPKPKPAPSTSERSGLGKAYDKVKGFFTKDAAPKPPPLTPQQAAAKLNPSFSGEGILESGLKTAKTVAKPFVSMGKGLLKSAPYLAAVADAGDVIDVATDKNTSGMDKALNVGAEVGSKAAKWAGATIGGIRGAALGAKTGSLAGVKAGMLGGGLAGYTGADALIKGGRWAAGKAMGIDADLRDPSERSDGIFTATADTLTGKHQPAGTQPAGTQPNQYLGPRAASAEPNPYVDTGPRTLAHQSEGPQDRQLPHGDLTAAINAINNPSQLAATGMMPNDIYKTKQANGVTRYSGYGDGSGTMGRLVDGAGMEQPQRDNFMVVNGKNFSSTPTMAQSEATSAGLRAALERGDTDAARQYYQRNGGTWNGRTAEQDAQAASEAQLDARIQRTNSPRRLQALVGLKDALIRGRSEKASGVRTDRANDIAERRLGLEQARFDAETERAKATAATTARKEAKADLKEGYKEFDDAIGKDPVAFHTDPKTGANTPDGKLAGELRNYVANSQRKVKYGTDAQGNPIEMSLSELYAVDKSAAEQFRSRLGGEWAMREFANKYTRGALFGNHSTNAGPLQVLSGAQEIQDFSDALSRGMPVSDAIFQWGGKRIEIADREGGSIAVPIAEILKDPNGSRMLDAALMSYRDDHPEQQQR